MLPELLADIPLNFEDSSLLGICLLLLLGTADVTVLVRVDEALKVGPVVKVLLPLLVLVDAPQLFKFRARKLSHR